jgi:hypothetical protein
VQLQNGGLRLGDLKPLHLQNFENFPAQHFMWVPLNLLKYELMGRRKLEFASNGHILVQNVSLVLSRTTTLDLQHPKSFRVHIRSVYSSIDPVHHIYVCPFPNKTRLATFITVMINQMSTPSVATIQLFLILTGS